MIFHKPTKTPACVIVTGVLILSAGCSLHAQESPSVNDMLSCFASTNETEAAPAASDDQCQVLAKRLTGVLKYPDRHSLAIRNGVLDGLERLAGDHADPRVRYNAAVWLAIAGSASGSYAQGVAARIQRVYDQSEDAAVRAVLVNNAPTLSNHAEAAGFLEHVARGTKGRGVLPVADEVLAVNALARLGGEGRAVLQELDASGGVTSHAGKKQLRRLAENGYRPLDAGQD